MEVTKIFELDAAHKLGDPSMSEEKNKFIWGKCCNLHGHRWTLHVTLEGPVPPDTGMVMNFTELKKIVTEKVIDRLDHNFLNYVIPLPTCENILPWIAEQLKELPLKRLTLYETPTSYATLECNIHTPVSELRLK